MSAELSKNDQQVADCGPTEEPAIVADCGPVDNEVAIADAEVVASETVNETANDATHEDGSQPAFIFNSFVYMGMLVPKDKIDIVFDAILTKIEEPAGTDGSPAGTDGSPAGTDGSPARVRYTIGDKPDIIINDLLYEKIYGKKMDLYDIQRDELIELLKGNYPEEIDRLLTPEGRLALKFLPTISFNKQYFLERIPVGKHADDFIIPLFKTPADGIYNMPTFTVQDVHLFPDLAEYLGYFRELGILQQFKFVTAFSNIAFCDEDFGGGAADN